MHQLLRENARENARVLGSEEKDGSPDFVKAPGHVKKV